VPDKVLIVHTSFHRSGTGADCGPQAGLAVSLIAGSGLFARRSGTLIRRFFMQEPSSRSGASSVFRRTKQKKIAIRRDNFFQVRVVGEE
jgi:hypothetical protein